MNTNNLGAFTLPSVTIIESYHRISVATKYLFANRIGAYVYEAVKTTQKQEKPKWRHNKKKLCILVIGNVVLNELRFGNATVTAAVNDREDDVAILLAMGRGIRARKKPVRNYSQGRKGDIC